MSDLINLDLTSAWVLFVILSEMLRYYIRQEYALQHTECQRRLDKGCHPW